MNSILVNFNKSSIGIILYLLKYNKIVAYVTVHTKSCLLFGKIAFKLTEPSV